MAEGAPQRSARPVPRHVPQPAPLHPAQALQRAIAGVAALTPADILALQRTLGNRAVQQLLATLVPGQSAVRSIRPELSPAQTGHEHMPAGRVATAVDVPPLAFRSAAAAAPVQRQSADQEEAMQMKLPAAEWRPPLLQRPAASDLPLQRTKLGTGTLYTAKQYVKWYFSKFDDVGQALRVIYEQIGVDADSQHRTQGELKKAGVIDDDDIAELKKQVDAVKGGGTRAPVAPARKKLTEKVWRHIWRGDFNKDKGRPTGYHWKGKGTESWLVGNGTMGRTQSNFYEEQVQVRDDKVPAIKKETAAKGTIAGTVKDDMSTFFPDAWSESDVKDAVELRDSQGHVTSKAAAGIVLVKSGGTIYPTIE